MGENTGGGGVGGGGWVGLQHVGGGGLLVTVLCRFVH